MRVCSSVSELCRQLLCFQRVLQFERPACEQQERGAEVTRMELQAYSVAGVARQDLLHVLLPSSCLE